MSNAQLLARIRREFREHPGIAVTLPQAEMIWFVGHESCTQAFETLLSEGFLKQVDDVFLWGDTPIPQFRQRQAGRSGH